MISVATTTGKHLLKKNIRCNTLGFFKFPSSGTWKHADHKINHSTAVCTPKRRCSCSEKKTTHTNCQNHMLMSKHGAHQNPAFTKAIPATCSKVQRHTLYPCSTWHFWFMCVCHFCTGCHADSPFKPQQACAANVFVAGFKQTTAVEENTWSYRHDPTRYNWVS